MDIKTKLHFKKKYDKGKVANLKRKFNLTLNKSAYVGMFILELSEVLTYIQHYDYIKCEYTNNSRLLFTETDSLIYENKNQQNFFVML